MALLTNGEQIEDNPVIYSPLDSSKLEFRILHVDTHRYDEAGRPMCRLCKASMTSNAAQYEAISWCWGDVHEKGYIVLDGVTTAVSKNAEEVIRCLCVRQKHSTVWLDAVCINQSDEAERAQQVAIMDRVYSQAARVLVWLGDVIDARHELLIKSALESIGMLAQQSLTLGLESSEEAPPGISETHVYHMSFEAYSTRPLPACDWTALKAFFSSPFFSRLWVVQEVMLSKEAVCHYGKYYISWHDVSSAAHWLTYSKYWRLPQFRAGVKAINNAAWIWRASNEEYDLTALLYMSIRFHVSRPIDKVYGLLGLLNRSSKGSGIEISSQILKPDYGAVLDDIYLAATRAAIEQRQSDPYQLGILIAAQTLVPPDRYQPTANRRPSWVVDLDYQFDQCRGSPTGYPIFREGAMNGLGGRVQFPSKDVLSVQGIVMAEVGATGRILSSSLLQSGVNFANEILQCRALARSAGLTDDEFAIAFTSSVNETRSEAVQDSGFLRTYRDCVTSCERLCDDDDPLDFWNNTETYVQATWTGSANKRFFTATQGYIGTGPPKMEVGDIVCALLGCRRPLVLRREGSSRWKLVGSAYVHGVMDGEFVKQLQAQGRFENEKVWFDIC